MNDNTVYLIAFDWSTTDCDGIETYLYRNYKDARKKIQRTDQKRM